MENSKLVQTSNDRGSKVSLDVRCEVKEVGRNMAKKGMFSQKCVF